MDGDGGGGRLGYREEGEEIGYFLGRVVLVGWVMGFKESVVYFEWDKWWLRVNKDC